MKLSVIIPTLNEERTIGSLIHRLTETPLPVSYELIVVDDRSTDRTFAIAQRLQQSMANVPMTVVRGQRHAGKGSCIRQGLRHATGDVILVQDGDHEYDPREIPKLLQPLLAGEADVVYGSRFLRRQWPDGMAWPNYVANRLLTWVTNRLYGLRLSDMETCYKMIPRERLTQLQLRASRFEFEPEVTAKLTRCRVRISEVDISYCGRTSGQGKKIRAADFFIALWTLLRYRFWALTA